MYFHSEAQEAEARLAFEREASGWKSSGRDVVTEVRPASIFWPAEEEHQQFEHAERDRYATTWSPTP